MTHFKDRKDGSGMSAKHRTLWTFAITSLALFMVSLDNLVVSTAIPVIRKDLHASVSQLEWTVNAYTLTFAVLLLTGAALGDRFGRRRLFAIGLGIFTAASAAAALAPSIEWLIAARAVQGVGGAIVTPLTLTILSSAVSPERRGLVLGAWGGISGLAVAIGPLVGGAVVEGISWQWIFWLNVPIGLALIPLAALRLRESRGPNNSLDLPGLGLASAGRLGILPWTAMPIFVAPIAGALSDRIGGRPLMAVGLAMQAAGLAWLAAVGSATTAYSEFVIPFVISGMGMALYFAPVANVVLSSVRSEEEGQASGANNAIRELGGVFGVAVLASVFAHYGGYGTGQTFVDGLGPALYVGAGVVAAGALSALAIRRPRRRAELEAQEAVAVA